MRMLTKFTSALAGLVLSGAAAVSPATAMPVGRPALLNQPVGGQIENVRFGGGGFHGGGFHGGGFHGGQFHGGGFRGHIGAFRGGYGYRHYGGRFLGGLAAGAIVGSALAYPYYYEGYPGAYVDNYDYGAYAGDGYVTADAAAACAQRFKSYDPESGTYLGYDGVRHPCP